jgi:cysteine dioxygenase
MSGRIGERLGCKLAKSLTKLKGGKFMKETTVRESEIFITFRQFVQYIQQVDVVLQREEIEKLLARVVSNPNDYKEFLACVEPYGRISVAKSEFGVAEMLVMTWYTDQQSPIHDHFESSCGIRVLQGKMTETLYDLVDSDKVCQTSTKEWVEGEITTSDASLDIHKISNRGEAVLVTLHIYSVPLDPTKMRRFEEKVGTSNDLRIAKESLPHDERVFQSLTTSRPHIRAGY